jgi:hypothetical protein
MSLREFVRQSAVETALETLKAPQSSLDPYARRPSEGYVDPPLSRR